MPVVSMMLSRRLYASGQYDVEQEALCQWPV
jgi:hypothetical protein